MKIREIFELIKTDTLANIAKRDDVLVALISLFKMGFIVDELNLGGDPISTYMVIPIGVLSVMNLLIYFLRSNLNRV